MRAQPRKKMTTYTKTTRRIAKTEKHLSYDITIIVCEDPKREGMLKSTMYYSNFEGPGSEIENEKKHGFIHLYGKRNQEILREMIKEMDEVAE